MTSLAPDQRAVLELVLRQGRSYGELSELLAIPEHDVRARADAGLRALAGAPPAGVDSGRIADWLLGQQPDAEAERTRAAVESSADARAWAATAEERLRGLGGASGPSVGRADEPSRRGPLEGPRPDAAAATPVPASLRSSRLGGALLLGLLVLAVAAVLAVVLLGGDDGDGQAAGGQPAGQEPRQQEQPSDQAAANDILLTGDSGAQGVMRLVAGDDGTVRFLLAAENMPANEGREVYAVWFTRDGGADARRLGFAQAQVGEDGILTTGGPQEGDEDRFPRWFATYDRVIVTRETRANARRPGPVVLEGELPG